MEMNIKNLRILALLSVLVIGIVLISGCVKGPEEKPTDEQPVTEKPTTEKPVNEEPTETLSEILLTLNCTPPDILFSGECCLDENYNGACDISEGITTTPGEIVEVSEEHSECGNALGETGENSTTCCKDCGCPHSEICVNNSCSRFVYVPRTNFTMMEICGNKYCRPLVENQSNCCKDCGCPSGQICSAGVCSNISVYHQPITMMNITPTTDTYIVVVINEIIVHDDTDPAGAGELMLFTFAASGEHVQKMHWPVGIWYSIDSGGKIEKNIPIFALKQSEMGERLALSVTAIDNDQLPGWLETFVNAITLPIEVLDSALSEPGLEIVTGRALNDALTNNEKIGSINKIYEKTNNWGVSDEQYELRGGGMTVKYSIRKVVVPRNSKMGVRVYDITFSDTGDYFDGEVWINMRAAANFGERDLAATFKRIPNRGTMDLGDGSVVKGAEMYDTDRTFMGRLNLLTFEANGPFIFLEVGGWDEDEPAVGDDHDSLGTLSYLYLYSDFDMPPQTRTLTYPDRVDYPWIIENKTIRVPFVTRGNMKVYYEFVRILE